jgi:AcrR family transcriptional regulator
MPRKTYHHGSLRETLLEVGEALIAEKGVEAFTLRECARRAGVSHGAPAHHFGDATGLLSELAAIGFEELDALMTRYRAEGAPEPYAQFVATGRAYVDYALQHPARFQLMFRGEKLRLESERLRTAADRTFGQLVQTLSVLPRRRGHEATALGLGEQAGLAWAIVHGVASLTLDNRGFVECVGGGRNVSAAVVKMLAAVRGAFGNVPGDAGDEAVAPAS